MKITIKQLLDRPEYRTCIQGPLTDAATEAYRAASASYPDGFIPDDELDKVEIEAPVARELMEHEKLC